MRFKTIAFALIVSSAVFILGCDDEDSSTIGGVRAYIPSSDSQPPLDSHTVQGSFYFVGGGTIGSTGDIFTPATGIYNR
jgi:hypothetical protein